MWNFIDIVKELGLPLLDISDAPESCGYYLLFADDGTFIYVGKATNLRERLQQHFSENEENDRIRGLVTFAIWQETSTIRDAEKAEGILYDCWVRITGLPPFANRRKPPASKLSDTEISAAKLRELLIQLKSL